MLADTINRAARRVPAWPIYILGLIPFGWWVYLGATGGLGAEPVEALEHELGEFALKLLIVVLAITPLMRLARVNLVKYRRALGIMTYVYVMLHFAVWLVLDVQILSEVWADIVKRPYVTVGFVAMLLMTPLALTSNNWSIRKLGPRWRKLHKLTYPVAVLGALHFVMLRKGFQLEPLIYMAIILGLVGLRYLPKPGRRVARA
ncbi:protein-methionine-sulfoxide reductase heme-binding subunit MsrQ [Mesobacterium pallidum]|uniref:protein-methionine-sulfoxide reductase heme-binding subunit MsrQ n=1 Tax=Mesobacterium pallidum TaxID=2872037 RepID=UPI001EE2CA11|nr:protein-methionine-sulfoxide reductase heme-binding subunit MsrQ [Mesobacterium pallidum]